MSDLAPAPRDTRRCILARIPTAEFVARWRARVGEPPAAMLEDRSDMIRLLVLSAPVAEVVSPLLRLVVPV